MIHKDKVKKLKSLLGLEDLYGHRFYYGVCGLSRILDCTGTYQSYKDPGGFTVQSRRREV